MRFAAAIGLFATLMSAACATTADEPSPQAAASSALISDPFEGFNRRAFAFNEGLDRYAIGPTARTYGYLPALLRNRVRDFTTHLNEPFTFVNALLQGETERAGTTAGRFIGNTVFGGLGLVDVVRLADGPRAVREDFGQTLAVWGVDDGPFLVVPFLGPSTGRDLLGAGVETAANPLRYFEYDPDYIGPLVNIGPGVLGLIDLRERSDGALEAIRASADPYSQLRSSYVQNRRNQINNGRRVFEDLPDFE